MKTALPSLSRWILLGGGLLVATMGLASSASAAILPATLLSNRTTTVSPSPTPDIEQQLQIEQLRQETNWTGQLKGFLPAGSVIVALIAAGWGVFVYLRDQRQALRLRTQLEITSNLNRLTDYGKEDAISSAQIVAALKSLNTLIDQSANRNQLLDDVTNIITTAVTDDIDFNDVRQVRFEALCLGNWEPYEAHLRSKRDKHKYVLYRYLIALRSLRTEHSAYVTMVSWDADTKKFTHPKKLIMEPENDFRLFQRLVEGIRSHSRLIDDDSQRAELARDFLAATANRQLTAQLLEGAHR
jgi:hypothetical protein